MDFNDIVSYLPDSVTGWVMVVPTVVGCSSVVAAAIAKLTPTKADDKVANWLSKAYGLLAKVGLHGVGHSGRPVRVVDNRSK